MKMRDSILRDDIELMLHYLEYMAGSDTMNVLTVGIDELTVAENMIDILLASPSPRFAALTILGCLYQANMSFSKDGN